MSEFQSWHGGACPVSPDAVVEVRTNIWPETITAQAKHWYFGARDWWTAHPEPLARITEYRTIEHRTPSDRKQVKRPGDEKR